jgi:arylsulfatase A-like enzyme
MRTIDTRAGARGDAGRRRRTALVVALGAAAGLALWRPGVFETGSTAERTGTVGTLPPTMLVEGEEMVTNLSAAFDRAAIEGPTGPTGVRLGALEPGFKLRLGGRQREAILAPPPARMVYRVSVPPGAVLRLSLGVEGRGKREPDASGVRFTIDIDGRQALARTINPAASRSDRRWFDERIALDEFRRPGQEMTLEFGTTAVQPGASLAGTPGWSHLRIVRQVERQRQLASPTAPNVLLLLVDTLRADRLGAYGAVPSPSPTLDRLAGDGLVFEEVASQAPWTLPSVASLFTGLLPRSHGVAGRSGSPAASGAPEPPADAHYLSDELDTIATRAQQAGVTTVGVSANPLVSRGTNLARGFETFAEFGVEGDGGWERADVVNRVFLDWLRYNGRYRFLGYLHYMDAHGPYDPPAAYRPVPPAGVRRRIARGDVHGFPLDGRRGKEPLSATELSYLRALYDAQIRYWDAQLAVLMEGLDAADLRAPTVVIVTSDHGEEFLEHGGLNHGRHLYDEVIKVPLIVTGPGIQRGRVPQQVDGIDIFPTVMGLLGIDGPRWLPGENVLAAPVGRPALSEMRRRDREGGTAELVALRTPTWKLIYAPAANRFELYDLRHDPAERFDRFGTAPEGAMLARELRASIDGAPAPPEVAGQDPGYQEKLRALGYLDDDDSVP